MKILDIPPENRPRERFLRGGADGLSDAELFAIILQTGTFGENAVDLSNRLIAAHGLERLAALSIQELQAIKGIGPAKAMQIKAIFELNKRVRTASASPTIKTAREAYAYLCPKLESLDRECFVVLHLNTRYRLVKEELISLGIIDETVLHPRELFKSAIKEGTSKFIIAHNHPSGDPNPSINDKRTTRTLVEAGKIIGISVIDHIIVGKNQYYSFRDKNQL